MRRQRGILLIAAVVLILIAAILGTAILALTSGSAGAGAQHLSATQALYVAESGLEKGILEWKNNAAYAGETQTMSVGNATGAYTVTTDGSDFSGNALPNNERRIRSVGSITETGAQRTVEAVVGPANLMPPWANTNFNQAPQTPCLITNNCQPTGWQLGYRYKGGTAYQPWDETGGPDGSRAAYVYKDNNGPSAATTAGTYTFSPPLQVTAPTTLTIGFDYWAELLGSGGANNYMQLYFTLNQQTPGTGSWTTGTFLSGDSGGWQHGTLSLSITGSGTVQIGSLAFTLVAKAGHAQKIWLDNITVVGPGDTTPQIMDWREVFP